MTIVIDKFRRSLYWPLDKNLIELIKQFLILYKYNGIVAHKWKHLIMFLEGVLNLATILIS